MKSAGNAATRVAQAEDRRIGRTRRAIKSALLELLHETPLERLSIREIADRADIGYTTFYRHYPDKEALLKQITNDEIAALLEYNWPILESSDSYSACLALCQYVSRNRDIWAVLTTGAAGAITKAEFVDQSRAWSTKWEPKTAWLPTDIGTTLIVGVHLELLSWWLRDAPDEPPERIAEILDKLIVSGLIKPH